LTTKGYVSFGFKVGVDMVWDVGTNITMNVNSETATPLTPIISSQRDNKDA